MIWRLGFPFLGSNSSSLMFFRPSLMFSSSEPCNNPRKGEEFRSSKSYFFFFFLAFFVAFFFPFAPHFPQDIFFFLLFVGQGSNPGSSRCINFHQEPLLAIDTLSLMHLHISKCVLDISVFSCKHRLTGDCDEFHWDSIGHLPTGSSLDSPAKIL